MNYKIRLYNRRGDLIEERYTKTLREAETIRSMHALLIGLEPEPTCRDFALYPTIWKRDAAGNYTRLLGY